MVLQRIVSCQRILLFLSLIGICCNINAQRNEIFNENISSLQVVGGTKWTTIPIINLNGNEKINISFDELSHEYHRYSYSIQHLEADWSESENIFGADYINGFSSDNIIDNIDESFNTIELYTHYSISLPNDRCQFKMSGNYCVTVFDEDNNNDLILKAYFMIVEPLVNINMSVYTNTDVDINNCHQQVDMNVNFSNISVSEPKKQIKTVLLQNGRWDNARINITPQSITTDGLKWFHCHDFIFDAGNEYHKFEALDETHTTMGLESVNWDGKEYHAWTWTDEPRPNYVYDESANGSFYIRNSDNNDNDITTEYVLVHFRLKSPIISNDIFINGAWTQDSFDNRYKMNYNEVNKQYETEIKLKQGYYSYQYLMLNNDGTTSFVPSEGNFFQTENQYQSLVYYRGNSDRTDRLIGFNEIDYK
nr:DUF5103 domain-containing protein [Prevotella sp.]